MEVSDKIICLIRPPAAESIRFSMASVALPLGLAYIVAALERAGRLVRVVDAVGEAPSLKTKYFKGYLIGLRIPDIVKRIPAEAQAVGISVVFTHEWPFATQLVEAIKTARPDLPVILGGEHISSLPEFCLATSRADYLVLGEGEETIVALVDAIDGHRQLEKVDGIAYRNGQAFTVNRRRARTTDIDDIAWPAWRHFKVHDYHRHRFTGGMYSANVTIPILGTRGCPYQCSYCSAPNMWTTQWIPRDPKLLVDEIEHYVRKFGARNFPFQDLTAIIQKKWIVTFCQEILDRGLDITWQFPTGTRCEAVDAEVAHLMKKSGMISMAYAPESGSETTRRFIKKKMKTDHLFDSIDAAVGAGLNIATFLVIGFPHDQPAHLEENLPFIDRLAEHGVSDVSIGFYMALPGTELFQSLYDAGKIKLDRAYFRHILDALSLIPSQSYCDSLSKSDLFTWKLRMFLRFYGARTRFKTRSGLGQAVYQAVRGLFGSARHDSRLQTAVRNAATSAWYCLISWFGPRWIPPQSELAMFSGWDGTYRNIHQQRYALGVAVPKPQDTSEIHKHNVISALARDHGTSRILSAQAE